MKLESSDSNIMKLNGGVAIQYFLEEIIYEQLIPRPGPLIGNSHHHPFAEYYIPGPSCNAKLLYLDGEDNLNVEDLPKRRATCVKDIPHQIIVSSPLMHLLIEATKEHLKMATVPLDHDLYKRAKKEELL